MAKTTINSWKVDGDHLTVDATMTDTSYRGQKVTVHFKGTGSMKSVLEGFIGSQKIQHSGRIEARAYEELKAKGDVNKDSKSLTDCSTKEKGKVQARTKEIAAKEIDGEVVNPFNLDVTPQDLTDLLAHVPGDFHGQVRSMYEAHGIMNARRLVISFEWATADEILPTETIEE